MAAFPSIHQFYLAQQNLGNPNLIRLPNEISKLRHFFLLYKGKCGAKMFFEVNIMELEFSSIN